MRESKLGPWRLVAGLRGENTHPITRAPVEVPISENPFAVRGTRVVGGQTITTYSAANTRDYIAYKWSRGLATTWGEYTDWMPSFAAKYPFAQNLSLKLGYNRAIKRPDLNRVAGNWEITVNDTTGDIYVTVPNPNLKPERSQRYSAMLEYFFQSAGTVSLHLFQTDLDNPIDSTPEDITAAEAGFGDNPQYADYYFRTYFNLGTRRHIRGLELAYSQQLRFFQNKFLRATSVFANYSQNASSPRPRSGTFYFPRSASGGVTWGYGKYFFQVNGTWTDETFTGANNVPANSVVTPNAPHYTNVPTLIDSLARSDW
jgi:outer membrane receptor protein involved in Fe transport